MKNLNNLLKQAQKMQADMAKIQEDMSHREVEASAGGGMITVVANGKQEILKIKIEPEVVNKEDIEMLQDLIIAGINEALRTSKDMMEEEMKKVAGGLSLKIPGF